LGGTWVLKELAGDPGEQSKEANDVKDEEKYEVDNMVDVMSLNDGRCNQIAGR